MTQRQNKKESFFKQILYPEKRPQISEEILERTRIVSDLQNKIERIIIKNGEYFSKLNELNRKNNEKIRQNKHKKSISPNQINKIFNNKSSYYLDKAKSKLVSKNRNLNFPFSKENTNKIQSKTFEKNVNKILLKKIKPSIFKNKENRYINNINQLKTNSSNVTEESLGKNYFKNKRIMRKEISSNLLKEKIGSFNRNNNKLEFKSFNGSKNNKFSNKKILPCESNITFTYYISSYNNRKRNDNLPVKKGTKLSRNLLCFPNNNLSTSKMNTYNNYNNIYSS